MENSCHRVAKFCSKFFTPISEPFLWILPAFSGDFSHLQYSVIQHWFETCMLDFILMQMCKVNREKAIDTITAIWVSMSRQLPPSVLEHMRYANFSQRWWRQKWEKGQHLSSLVMASTGGALLGKTWHAKGKISICGNLSILRAGYEIMWKGPFFQLEVYTKGYTFLLECYQCVLQEVKGGNSRHSLPL